MKKIYSLIATTLLLTGCIDYDDVSREVSVSVQLQMPAEFTEGSDFEGHDVTLSAGSATLTARTDAQGVATFTGLVPDVYDVSTSWKISGAQYRQFTGEQQSVSGCTVTGTLNAHLIKEDGQHIVLATNLSVDRDIVISKIASAGSKDFNNRNYMAGKYLELYNQADDSVDVSGLYIGLLDSSNPQPFTLDNLHELYADSAIVVKQVFRIPAEKPFMLAPGATVLLTNSAIDHTTVGELEPNLLDADFEAKDVTGNTQNNPATPALITAWSAYSANATMNLVQGGPCGVVIFRTDEAITEWPLTYAYGKTSGQQYLLVPKRVVLDGVDYLKNKATGVDVTSKRLYPEIDASYTHINAASGWTGEVVYRRTASIAADGHKILMDTNNSLNDFKVSTTIKPRQYDEGSEN